MLTRVFLFWYKQEAHLAAGNGVQIIGKVNPDLSVKVLSSLDLGTGVGKGRSPHHHHHRIVHSIACRRKLF